MLIEKFLNKDGFRITFDEPVVFIEDTENFTIVQTNYSFFYNQAFIDKKTIELFLTFDPTLSPEEQIIFLKDQSFKLLIKTKNYSGSFELFYSELPTVGTNVDIIDILDGNLTNDFEFYFDIVKDENDLLSVFIDYIKGENTVDQMFTVTINEYKLHLFEDYSEKTYKLFLDCNLEPVNLEFNFKKDFVYTISVSFNKTKKKKNFLPFKPNIYFSSAYQLKMLLSELNLELNLFTGFESFLQIWKYSELSFSKAGLTEEILPLLSKGDYMILSNYVSYKIILQKYMSNFLSLYLDQTNTVPNQASNNLKLGDFSISGNLNAKEVISSINSIIRGYESEIKEISFRYAHGVINRLSIIETRNSLTLPGKNSLIKVRVKPNSKYFGNWWD